MRKRGYCLFICMVLLVTILIPMENVQAKAKPKLSTKNKTMYVLDVLQTHIANVLDMERIFTYINTVPFQEIEIKELERRKEIKEQEVKRCQELRDMLYEDLKDGVVSKEDYAELYEGYSNKRKKAEEAVRKIRNEIKNVLEAKTDKYEWLRYFKEYQNISELSRAVVVELIDRVRVFDKKRIEVDFAFNDCFQSALRQIQSAGCTVSMEENGRLKIQRREVV